MSAAPLPKSESGEMEAVRAELRDTLAKVKAKATRCYDDPSSRMFKLKTRLASSTSDRQRWVDEAEAAEADDAEDLGPEDTHPPEYAEEPDVA